MANQNQHVVIRQTNGNQAATSYGPRTTSNEVPLHRPVRAEEREIVIQLNGTECPVVEVDFADDSKSMLRAGDFVEQVRAWSHTGAAVAISLEDRQGTVTALPALAPAADEWVVERDLDINIADTTQFSATIADGEEAVVIIKYWSAETPGDGGVLHRTRDNALVAGVDFLDPDGDGLPGPAE